MNKWGVRAVALIMTIAGTLAVSTGVSNAATRDVDTYIYNAGAFVGEVHVFQGQFPNGGTSISQARNKGTLATRTTLHLRTYYEDELGVTIRGAASSGSQRWVVFGPGAAQTICFRFDGTTIAGFQFNIVGC